MKPFRDWIDTNDWVNRYVTLRTGLGILAWIVWE